MSYYNKDELIELENKVTALTEINRLQSEECKQLQQDKAELVEALTSIDDYLKRFCKNALNQKLIIKSIAEILEKHK